MSYPDLKTDAQYRQEISGVWAMLDMERRAATVLREEIERLTAELAALHVELESLRKIHFTP